MKIDLQAATSFMASHGRLLDRRRLGRLLDPADPGGVLAALAAYRNPDGGYGWGLESDLRSAESQPVAAMHALEVLAEVAPVTTPDALGLCEWLAAHTLADGGLPFALPVADTAGSAAFWFPADPTTSSMMMTTQVAANALRVARHDPAVAGHPWLVGATAYCVDAIRNLDAAPHAYELLFALRFVDAASGHVPDPGSLLEHLGRYVPAEGSVHVDGGAADERLHPLDFTPDPSGPVRSLFPDEVVAADLDRLVGLQQPDGGWVVDFVSASPAAALEWRGYATVAAVTTLLANGVD